MKTQMTCNQYIIEYLEKYGETPGGTIETFIAGFTKFKPGTINRALRQMSADGKILQRLKKFDNSPRFVVYWI